MVPAKIEKFNPFQVSFIKWGVNKKSCLLQAQPGAGKTLAVTGLYLFLRQQVGGKLLVVTARKAADAFKKANIKDFLLLTLFTKQDLAVLYSGYDFPADIYIMSNTLMVSIINEGSSEQKKAFTELLKKVTVLCIDEIHAYRTYSSARFKAMKHITDYYHRLIVQNPQSHRLVGVTATPIFKNLENLHPLFSLLCRVNPLGTWKQFVDRYCIVEQMQAYGNRKMYTSNGSHSYKNTIMFDNIVGYKNQSELYRIVNPYIFVWEETDFKFTFNLHYYSLTPDEKVKYKESIKGLGLDKTYAIDMESGGKHTWIYRDRSDVLYLPDKREVRVDALCAGVEIVYNGVSAVVGGLYEKKVDAGFATRAVKAQQCNSKAVGKLKLIADLIRSKDCGVLVYFNFLESVDVTSRYLMQEFPGRRVVTLTGGTQRFNTVVSSLGRNDIVLMSRVASQSLDMYIPRLIVAECFGLTPGGIEQLCGRMTRENADYRNVSVDIILRDGENIDAYFYEFLRFRLKSSSSNVFVKSGSLPVSLSMSSIPDHLIDLYYLKKRLLWNVS